MEEIWRPVSGFDGYEVSSFGRVRGVERRRPCKDGGTRAVPARELAQYVNSWGYRVTSMCVGNKVRQRVTHRLVLEAFHGPAPTAKHMGNHIDGEKANNRADNLEWCTAQENSQHSYDIGLSKRMRGEASGMAKLTEPQVRDIRQLARTGLTYRKIAARFGMSSGQISQIVNRRHWAHVE